MLGSLTIIPSGVLASCPSQARSSDCLCSGVRRSGKAASILKTNQVIWISKQDSKSDQNLPATEMSLVSRLIPMGVANLWNTGRREYVASIGASSVTV